MAYKTNRQWREEYEREMAEEKKKKKTKTGYTKAGADELKRIEDEDRTHGLGGSVYQDYYREDCD